MSKTIRPDDLAVLHYLDEQADTLRQRLALHQRGEVVTWYESETDDREFVVEADGYAGFALVEYQGRNPNDRLEHHRANYDDEDAAWRAARRLGDYRVAWEERDTPLPHEDD